MVDLPFVSWTVHGGPSFFVSWTVNGGAIFSSNLYLLLAFNVNCWPQQYQCGFGIVYHSVGILLPFDVSNMHQYTQPDQMFWQFHLVHLKQHLCSMEQIGKHCFNNMDFTFFLPHCKMSYIISQWLITVSNCIYC